MHVILDVDLRSRAAMPYDIGPHLFVDWPSFQLHADRPPQRWRSKRCQSSFGTPALRPSRRVGQEVWILLGATHATFSTFTASHFTLAVEGHLAAEPGGDYSARGGHHEARNTTGLGPRRLVTQASDPQEYLAGGRSG
jgi:hypothetical protein